MGTTLHLSARDFFRAAKHFSDRIIVRSVVSDAACQDLGHILWKCSEDRLPDTTWNAQLQLTAGHWNLGRIHDLDGVLAVLLQAQRELLAFDLLESSCSEEIEHHILRAHDPRIC